MNRLARESSPYLRQHAGNPVDWYPWGEEAFARARTEDKPVLLSVGYSACHWCHVMERESFEDPDIARLMNESFVSVKVDREERPDVDHVYMQAVQAMTRHGGWPMTVFLTPDGVPFYGGTYFPPADRHGLPGFPRVLRGVAEAWRQRRGEILESGRSLVEELGQAERLRDSTRLLTEEVLWSGFRGLAAEFDDRDGGVAHAPKFPQPMLWEFVLRVWKRGGDERAAEMARKTLTRMARGGIYDQLGGGFHRYSVDGHWLVPHFEKMLYDNGQLASLYLHAYQAFGDAEYRRICEETLDYVLREMTDPSGGFYSAQDADSEGEEGKFFVWTLEEIRDVLGRGDAAGALRYWGVDLGPNFEGKNILFVAGEPEVDRVASARATLLAARAQRVRPGLDDKVLAAWNGLACRALAEAGRALERVDYVTAAVRNAEFLLGRLRRDGRLMRVWSPRDDQAKIPGYLDDYAMVAAAMLEVYEATFDRRWLDEATRLGDEMLSRFWDEERDGFFDTSAEHDQLVVRPRNLFDNAVPSGSAVAVETLLRLAVFTGEERYQAIAARALRPMADLMARHPAGFGRWLSALDRYLGPAVEIAILWPAAADGARLLIGEVFARFLPNRAVAGAASGSDVRGIPLLEGREALEGRATAYVCRRFACRTPTTSPEELARQLTEGV
jgi:uncharacterized protein YyaL (SSP411 family)